MASSVDAGVAPRSILEGAPLCDSALPTPVSLATLLENATQAERGCVFVDAQGNVQRWSYRDLWGRAVDVALQLKRRGFGPGTFAILQLHDARDFLSATWGSFMAGVVPVPLAPALHSRSLEKLHAVSRALPEAVLVATATFARELQPHLAGGQVVLDIAELTRGGCDSDATRSTIAGQAPGGDAVALLLVTSGSSGTPKLVALTHRQIIRRTVAYAMSSGVGAEDVTLNWMPLDHVGGLVMFHIRAVYSGAAQVQVATEYIRPAPLRWLDLIEAYGVNVTWAPNFAFRAVVDALTAGEGRRWNLSSVSHWVSGGEMVVRATMQQFCRSLAPSGLNSRALRPVWGMSETSSGVTENGSFDPFEAVSLQSPVSVGPPIPGVAIRIVGAAGVVLPEGRTGALEVKGAGLTLGYWGDPERTHAAFTSEGWFRTGDLAIIRGGELSICAREDEVIIVNGLNHHPSEIEQLALRAEPERVMEIVASGTRTDADDTDQLVLFVVLRPAHAAEREAIAARLREEVLMTVGVSVAYLVALEQNELPRTDSGKVQRRQLRRQFEAGLFDDRQPRPASGKRAWPVLEQTWLAVPERASVPAREPMPVDAGRAARGTPEHAGVVLAGPARDLLDTTADLVSRAGMRLSRADELVGALALAARRKCETVVYVVPARADPVPEARAIDAWSERVYGTLGEIAAAAKIKGWPKNLVVVTFGGRHVLPTDAIGWDGIGMAGIWGTLRVLRNENPEVRVRVIDVDPDGGAASLAGALLDALRLGEHDGNDAELAYRGGVRHRPRFEARAPEALPTGLAARGKSIIISGGLGGLGLVMAEHFARRHAGKIVLIARREPTRGVAERLARCSRDTGVPIEIELGDVTVASQLERAVARAVIGAPPVGLLIHAAGAFGDSPVSQLTRERATEVMAARVAGALNLHLACRNVGYQRYVVFSSVVGLLGYPGFGSYAAACEMQQMLTAKLRQDGFPVTIASWPGWADDGRAVGETVRHNEHVGLCTIDTPTALAVLERIIAENRPQNQVLALDVERWAKFVPASRGTPLLCSTTPLRRDTHAEWDAGPEESLGSDVATQAHAPSSLSQARSMSAIEAILSSHLASVLSVEPHTLDGSVRFDALGLSSMDALLFRDRVEREFSVSLTPGFAWRHPTLRELAAHLLG